VTTLEEHCDELHDTLGQTTLAYHEYWSVFQQLSSLLEAAPDETLIQKAAEVIETGGSRRVNLRRRAPKSRGSSTIRLLHENSHLSHEIDRLAARIRKLSSMSSAGMCKLAQLKERH
jgi:hypothetical protein